MKYIDSEKLLAEIERRRLSNRYIDTEGYENELLEIITSLQQEQTPTEREIAEAHRYAEMIRERDKARIQKEQPKEQSGKFVFPKYLYARTKDNKTIDMSYAPQDMTAIEYIRNDFVQQEQPEVDVVTEYDEQFDSDPVVKTREENDCTIHFNIVNQCVFTYS